MSEPTKESRDAAAQAAGFADWDQADTCGLERTNKSITAHARTLDKLHGRTPVDPLVDEAQSIADDFRLNLSAMPKVEAALQKALRRGMELAPKPRMPTKAEVVALRYVAGADFYRAVLELWAKCSEQREGV